MADKDTTNSQLEFRTAPKDKFCKMSEVKDRYDQGKASKSPVTEDE